MDFFRRRRELQELHQVVLVDHLAGRGGDVFAKREGLGVGHRNLQLALAGFQVVKQAVQAPDQVFAFAVDGGFKHLRVGGEEVGRGDGVHGLAGVEIDLFRGLGVEAFHLLHGRLQPIGAQQVGLLDEVEDHLFVPGAVLETSVAGVRFDHRGHVFAGQSLGRRFP